MRQKRKNKKRLAKKNEDTEDKPTEVLSQDEIDQLLTGISGSDINATFGKTIEAFEDYLSKRQFIAEPSYGMFEKDVAVARFFDDPNGESALADIRARNQTENMGNVKIPNTNIELINYSKCPNCGHIHSMKDVMHYYSNPKPEASISRQQQFRLDTRLSCIECGTFFLPTLVIADGTPKNECQFLCRMQTVAGIEKWYNTVHHKPVLTVNPENVIKKDGDIAWRNDVDLTLLSERPGLVSNFLQYTPAPLMLDLIEGKNLVSPQPLYGAWRGSGSWRIDR